MVLRLEADRLMLDDLGWHALRPLLGGWLQPDRSLPHAACRQAGSRPGTFYAVAKAAPTSLSSSFFI
jgi:hypothetical protein